MLGLGTIAVTLLERLAATSPTKTLVIIETGTLRDPEMEKGWESEERSTLSIARWIASGAGPRPKPAHVFHSIDSSKSNIEISKKVLSEAKVADMVEYHLGDSRAVLELINTQIDFALLDSDTDPKVTLREFELCHALMRWPGIILIDDVYDKGAVNKGMLVLHEAARFRVQHRRIGHTVAIAFGPKAEQIVTIAGEELNAHV